MTRIRPDVEEVAESLVLGTTVEPLGPPAEAAAPSAAKSLLWNYAGTASIALTGFVATPFVIRGLGVDAFGAVAIINAMSAYAILADFGIGLSGTKMIAEHSMPSGLKAIRGIYSSMLLFYALGALLVVIAGVSVLPLVGHISVPEGLHRPFLYAYLISLASVVLSFGGAALSGTLHGLMEFGSYNSAVIAGALVGVAGSVIGAVVMHSIIAVSCFSLVATVIGQGWKLRAVRRHGLRFSRSAVDRQVMGRLLTFGSSVFLISVAIRIGLDSDSIILGAVSSVAAVGIYQTAANPALAVRRIADQLNIVALTTMSRAGAEERLAAVASMLLGCVRYSAALLAPVLGFVIVFGDRFLKSWVGIHFVSAWSSLIVLIAAGFLLAIQSIGSQVLIALQMQRLLAVVLLGEAVINVILSVALHSVVGIVGVALGTTLPLVVSTVTFVLPRAASACDLALAQIYVVIVKPLVAAAVASGLLLALRPVLTAPAFSVVLGVGLCYVALYALILLAADRDLRALIAREVVMRWPSKGGTSRNGLRRRVAGAPARHRRSGAAMDRRIGK